MDKAFAERFAGDWIDSWNAHDLDRVLSHYAHDFEMSSPFIIQIVAEASGTLRGKATVAAYWRKALHVIPDLHFELISVLVGVGSITLYYKGARGRLAAEVFHFDANQKISRAVAHYDVQARVFYEATLMADRTYPLAIVAAEAPARAKPSNYPEPFASRMAGRQKHPLGDVFGLTNFGVNLTKLAPNAASALRHAHTKQDEFVYILQGHPTLHTDEGRTKLSPGMCAGFKAGTRNGHRLVNETDEEVVYLEVGDRTRGDEGSYPDDDLQALLVDGKWKFLHKDGTPY